MNFNIDIYQLKDNRIHVVLRGDAVGMAAFGDPEVFAKFVEACQDFLDKTYPEDSASAKEIIDRIIEQSRQLPSPIPDVFLDAFADDDQR
jgi:hypothetical protein